MTSLTSSIFHLTDEQLQSLRNTHYSTFPELEAARHQKQQLEHALQTQRILQQTQHLMADIATLPQTNYTSYRIFRNSGERLQYENPYFLKRARLSAAALRLFLTHSPSRGIAEERGVRAHPSVIDSNQFGQGPKDVPVLSSNSADVGVLPLRDTVQDYLWSICEESNWVLPAHESEQIDLFAAETGFLLAETLHLLGDTLHEEVRHRVRGEIEHRVCDPYLRFYKMHHWYQGHSNWNGVCNSAIAATFVLLEPDPVRLIHALEVALSGLHIFLEGAFEEDGSSTEGVSYWHYGLFNFVALAELLHARSHGAIDLLANAKMRKIAAFPAQLHLSGSSFASFADCDEQVRFHPGILTRLAERTGETSLLDLLAHPTEPDSDWRLSMMLRDILWWDGSQHDSTPPTDAYLPIGGTARLVTQTQQGTPIVLSLKAGHNNEQHNHNDIGSFLLHSAGENLLTDPGRGLYTRDYFGARRYENIFTNSYGHSVPRIDGMLQGTGRAFTGTLLPLEDATISDGYKQIALEFAAAYSCADLKSARREFRIATEGNALGTLWLRDHFQFTQEEHEIEEAFVTWLACEVDQETARIHGRQHDILLTIEQPQGVHFQLELLEEQSKANQKANMLKRLSIALPKGVVVDVCVRISIRERQPFI